MKIGTSEQQATALPEQDVCRTQPHRDAHRAYRDTLVQGFRFADDTWMGDAEVVAEIIAEKITPGATRIQYTRIVRAAAEKALSTELLPSTMLLSAVA